MFNDMPSCWQKFIAAVLAAAIRYTFPKECVTAGEESMYARCQMEYLAR